MPSSSPGWRELNLSILFRITISLLFSPSEVTRRNEGGGIFKTPPLRPKIAGTCSFTLRTIYISPVGPLKARRRYTWQNGLDKRERKLIWLFRIVLFHSLIKIYADVKASMRYLAYLEWNYGEKLTYSG